MKTQIGCDKQETPEDLIGVSYVVDLHYLVLRIKPQCNINKDSRQNEVRLYVKDLQYVFEKI